MCSKIDFSNSIRIYDSLNIYYAEFPSDDWFITKELMNHSNGITGSDSTKGYLRFMAITEIDTIDSSESDEEAHENILKEFDVLDFGEVSINSQDYKWHLVDFDENIIPIYTLFVSRIINKKRYLINLSTEKKSHNYRESICSLESFIKEISFAKEPT